MTSQNLVLISVGITTLVFIILFLATRTRYSCTETGCEKSIFGSFNSKNTCESTCQNKPVSSTKQASKKWACVPGSGDCFEAESGYDTRDECISRCPMPVVTTTVPVFSDWGQLWSNRYRPLPWLKPYWVHRRGGGWRRR